MNKEKLSEPKRIAYIDTSKAICIFLMVVGHWTTNDILYHYIYSFHMPAFFIISGFLFKPHSWKKTIISFSVPVIIFSLINLFIKLLLGEITLSSVTFPHILYQIISYRYGLGDSLFIGIWFLWALIGLRYLFGDIVWLRISRKYYIPITIFAFFYMTFEKYLISVDTLFRGYYIGRMIPCIPFFCFGFFLKDIQWSPKQIPSNYLWILCAIFIIVPYYNSANGIFDNDYGYSFILYTLCAIISSLLLFYISEKIPRNNYLETISRGTLVILGTHEPLLHIQSIILPQCINFLLPFTTIVLCFYLTCFCDKYCPILLGRG